MILILIAYIKQADINKCILVKKKNKYFKILIKLILKLKSLCSIIKIIEVENKFFLEIPDIIKCSEKKVIKVVKKVNKILYYKDIKNIVLDNNLNNLDIFKNELYSENINILNGRWLFKFLVYDSIQYISNIQNKKMHMQDITILVNDNSEINIDAIINIGKNVKTLKIVTNHIEKFKYVEKFLYDNFGIIVSIMNNTKKSLQSSKIIINMDFPEQLFKKFNINKKSIIINVSGKINMKNKAFNGININYYNIHVPKNILNQIDSYNIFNNFNLNILYESLIYRKDNFDNIIKNIKQDNIKIKNLVGMNGIIDKTEYNEEK